MESARDVILRISREVWTNSERTLAEEKSAAIHVRELKAVGFKVISGTSNIRTAFPAKWAQESGSLKIGFLPEYDAAIALDKMMEQNKTPGTVETYSPRSTCYNCFVRWRGGLRLGPDHGYACCRS